MILSSSSDADGHQTCTRRFFIPREINDTQQNKNHLYILLERIITSKRSRTPHGITSSCTRWRNRYTPRWEPPPAPRTPGSPPRRLDSRLNQTWSSPPPADLYWPTKRYGWKIESVANRSAPCTRWTKRKLTAKKSLSSPWRRLFISALLSLYLSPSLEE